MLGNVYEWVEDDYHNDYTGAPADGSAWVTGEDYRVVRGGSWGSNADSLHSANRARFYPTSGGYSRGFRCVQSSL